MSNIKWEEGAVSYAVGKQWNHVLNNEVILGIDDFQLNEIRIGDELEIRGLDEYAKTIDVLSLFGFEPLRRYGGWDAMNHNPITVTEEGYGHTIHESPRKITYQQLMAIGKLKRAMIEREHLLNYGKHGEEPAPKIAPDLTPDVEFNSDWSDEHYNHFYQLNEEDIKAGQIKVDAYFVNRMWKINSWEDTGAGFHILKTLPRIANNKNSLKRELVALKKQVDILCKLHGVDDNDTN